MMSADYFKELGRLLSKIETQDGGMHIVSTDEAISKITSLLVSLNKKNKIAIIGNGGSASIASHIVTDFLKNAGLAALAFNDSSLLTCISNDLGYEYVFQKPIEMLLQRNDVLFAISSSGKSKNILNAAKKAQDKGCLVITMSGFAKDNPLRQLGRFNFYVPSNSYGYVEVSHLAICHCIVDRVIKEKDIRI